MCQENLLTAVPRETEFIHDLFLLGLRYAFPVVIGSLAVRVTLKLLESALVVEPLVGQELATVHTAHRDDHLAMVVGLMGPV